MPSLTSTAQLAAAMAVGVLSAHAADCKSDPFVASLDGAAKTAKVAFSKQPASDHRLGAIVWPEKYMPATTDNYVSNEITVPGVTAAEAWKYLNNTKAWPTYYANASEIAFRDGTGPELHKGARFRFTTFGFPVEAEVTEYTPPAAGKAGRVAWHGWVEGDAISRLDVHHAWLMEDLPGGRLRLVTQETQIGKPAQDLAKTKPNPMLNAHQAWIDGIACAATTKLQF